MHVEKTDGQNVGTTSVKHTRESNVYLQTLFFLFYGRMAEVELVITDLASTVEQVITEEQKAIVSLIEKEAKIVADAIFLDADLSVHIKVTKLVAEMMKLLQKARVNGSKISGPNKKEVLLYWIKEYIKNLPEKDEFLSIFESMAGHLIETLVDVSRGLGKIIATVEEDVSCCLNLLAILKK